MSLGGRTSDAWRRLRSGAPMNWRGSVSQVRAQFWRMMHDLESDAPQMHAVRELTVAGGDGPLPARLYTPFAVGAPTGPGLVFFHGGGFVVGDLESHDVVCRRLADAARVRVLSVAYRLAPEHKFPAAPDDTLAATRWALEHAASIGFDPSRTGVGGDSAGGNLAAVVAQGFKREGHAPLKAQVLIYPCTQFLSMTPSQLRLQEGYVLTQAAQDFFVRQYLPNREAAHDWRASPLVTDDLAGLPPAYVVTAGFDPLLDEGKAYADRLAACGTPVTYRDYGDQVHGFFNMTALSKTAREAIAACGRWLAKTMAE